jgi:hypothetical protein
LSTAYSDDLNERKELESVPQQTSRKQKKKPIPTEGTTSMHGASTGSQRNNYLKTPTRTTTIYGTSNSSLKKPAGTRSNDVKETPKPQSNDCTMKMSSEDLSLVRNNLHPVGNIYSNERQEVPLLVQCPCNAWCSLCFLLSTPNGYQHDISLQKTDFQQNHSCTCHSKKILQPEHNQHQFQTQPGQDFCLPYNSGGINVVVNHDHQLVSDDLISKCSVDRLLDSMIYSISDTNSFLSVPYKSKTDPTEYNDEHQNTSTLAAVFMNSNQDLIYGNKPHDMISISCPTNDEDEAMSYLSDDTLGNINDERNLSNANTTDHDRRILDPSTFSSLDSSDYFFNSGHYSDGYCHRYTDPVTSMNNYPNNSHHENPLDDDEAWSLSFPLDDFIPSLLNINTSINYTVEESVRNHERDCYPMVSVDEAAFREDKNPGKEISDEPNMADER